MSTKVHCVYLWRICQDDVSDVNITLLHMEINDNMFISQLLLDNIYYIKRTSCKSLIKQSLLLKIITVIENK